MVSDLVNTGLPTIIAHLGKSAYPVLGGESLSEEDFKNFVSKMIVEYKISGAEIDYRNYKNTGIDFNQLTKETLLKLSSENNLTLYATGGSDSHLNLF
ncbi:MAG: hypothetical protein ACOX50_04865 [Patescibacteria group bacterium]|jgi:hypothetical protein